MSVCLGGRTRIVDQDVELGRLLEELSSRVLDGVERVQVHLDDLDLAVAVGGADDFGYDGLGFGGVAN